MPTLPVVARSRPVSRQLSRSSTSSLSSSSREEKPLPNDKPKSGTPVVMEFKASQSREQSPVGDKFLPASSSSNQTLLDEDKPSRSKTAPKTKNKFKCVYCGFIEKSTYALEAHLVRHERYIALIFLIVSPYMNLLFLVITQLQMDLMTLDIQWQKLE